MSPDPYPGVSRRERQLLDALHRLGEASVQELVDALPDGPSYNAARVTLSILEKKGHVRHRSEGKRYVYRTTAGKGRARRSALRHLVSTFFDGSVPSVVSTLVRSQKLSDDELDELSRLIAEEKRRRGE